MTTEKFNTDIMITEENKNGNMVTIAGGIISKLKGTSITFVPRCEKCGNAEHPESTVTLTVGVTEVSTKKCSKCGNNQIIKMKLMVV